ncbi:MAG: DUF2220 family protein [Gammaproteobacteria bacterium]|nr:DUF2220 family protein [Gammaproteobacteria bacterium]MDH5803074.1 DUF2220 family protein [Gammaproteobacteria bacterium]
MNDGHNTKDWGLLPESVRNILRQKEWDNPRNLRDRLTGKRGFPLSVSLKAPTGAQALQAVSHFHDYIKQWQQATSLQVSWEQKQYRELGQHDIPVKLHLENLDALIRFLGPQAVKRNHRWQEIMAPVLAFNDELHPVLVQHLLSLEKMDRGDIELVPQLLPQLHQGMGQAGYLRALPLVGVDTKFLEKHYTLISDLMDCHTQGDISQSGGLSAWLNCSEPPNAWLSIRPLCQKTQNQMGGFNILQLSSQTLIQSPLPASKLIIVENLQSGYALPPLDDTIAIFGGGANVSWLQAPWFKSKNTVYWGDIDTWGFKILSDARQHMPDLNSIMMDKETYRQFRHRAVTENSPCEKLPTRLRAEEIELYDTLLNTPDARLEQERLSADYIREQLRRWLEK